MKKNSVRIIGIGLVCLLCIGGLIFFVRSNASDKSGAATETVASRQVNGTILADGTVVSQNEADLHFQVGGRLQYLPFKEGDAVTQGQTIAQLDTYSLQRQLTAALNTYRSTRDTFDQTQANSQNSDILQNQQRVALQNSGVSLGTDNSVIQDMAKRIVDQNQASLDNSVISVELANYSLQLATLTSPITGVIMHEDTTVPGVNVTPLTTFSVVDPANLVFRTTVSEDDISFIAVGASATITLHGATGKQLSGTVTKIYPQKITQPNGDSMYRVDITSDDLSKYGKLAQNGTVLIMNRYQQQVLLVPAWTVLNHAAIWVSEDNKPVLKKITVGDTIGSMVEVLRGLSSNDRIIAKPETVIQKKYLLL